MSKASCICGSPHGQHYADCPVLLRSEITRLRNELHLAQEWSAQVIAGQEQDIAEITRLRAEVEDLRNRLHHVHRLWANNEHALRAENERLRTALEKMQRSRDRYRQAWEAEKVRARAALEGKHD